MNHTNKQQAGNGATKDASVWHVVRETRIDKWHKNPDGSSKTHEGTLIQRDDGLSVERTGMGRPEEMTEFFTCKGTFGEFKFTASRWNLLKAEPVDTYTVNLYNYVQEPDLKLALSHAKDIESALLHYPVHQFHKNMPVKDVVFRTGDVRSPVTSHAEEIA